ncbi:hypothetical protein [Streptomyces niveus]|uniref:hypothetical protein n=1 Tax=Streptomyces niveus TaxID=193462 RepID=UPI003643E1DB
MIATAITVGLALLGYVATYLNSLRLSQRQERLSRLNRQLSDLYGPLFALTESNSRTYSAFMDPHFWLGSPPLPGMASTWHSKPCRAWELARFIMKRPRYTRWATHNIVSRHWKKAVTEDFGFHMVHQMLANIAGKSLVPNPELLADSEARKLF